MKASCSSANPVRVKARQSRTPRDANNSSNPRVAAPHKAAHPYWASSNKASATNAPSGPSSTPERNQMLFPNHRTRRHTLTAAMA